MMRRQQRRIAQILGHEPTAEDWAVLEAAVHEGHVRQSRRQSLGWWVLGVLFGLVLAAQLVCLFLLWQILQRLPQTP